MGKGSVVVRVDADGDGEVKQGFAYAMAYEKMGL